MPVPASPEFRRKALALADKIGPDAAAEKLTQRGTPVTGRAIRKWAAAKEPKAPPPAPVPAEAQEGLPPEFVGIDPDALDYAALDELSRDIVGYRRDAKAAGQVRTYIPLARLEMEVRVALHKVRPPAKVDPETDPANVEAAELLLTRLEALVAEAELPAAPAPPLGETTRPAEERAA